MPRCKHCARAAPLAGADVAQPNQQPLAVRPYCNTEHYWQVYFDTNKAIADTLGAAGFLVAPHPVKLSPYEPSSRAAGESQAMVAPSRGCP